MKEGFPEQIPNDEDDVEVDKKPDPSIWDKAMSMAKDFHRDETTMGSGEHVEIGGHHYTIDYSPNYSERDFRFGFKALEESSLPVGLRPKSMDLTGLGLTQAKKVFGVLADFIEERRKEHEFGSVSFKAADSEEEDGGKLAQTRLSLYKRLLEKTYPDGVMTTEGTEGRFFFTTEDHEWFKDKQKNI